MAITDIAVDDAPERLRGEEAIYLPLNRQIVNASFDQATFLDESPEISALRAAIDEGLASGIADDGVFARVRKLAGLPPRA